VACARKWARQPVSLERVDFKFSLRHCSLSSNASINNSPITVYISFPIIILETFKFNLNTNTRRNPSFSVLQSATGSLVEKTRFDTTKVDKEIRQNRFVTLG